MGHNHKDLISQTIVSYREVSNMDCNTQNAKIASITEKLLLLGWMLAARFIMPGHVAGGIMSTRKKRWNSVIRKLAS